MNVSDNRREVLENILKMRLHQPPGPLYKTIQKQLADVYFESNEMLKGIYCLTESHAPTYRIKATYRYDKLQQNEDVCMTLNKDYVQFQCPIHSGSELMLKQIAELPKEWTIVQITTKCTNSESQSLTTPLHLTVFNCGENKIEPIYINIPEPKDINDDVIDICTAMKQLLIKNKSTLQNICPYSKLDTSTVRKRLKYKDERIKINNELKNIITDIEKFSLGEFRCLLIGKFTDVTLETNIRKQIETVIHQQEPSLKLTEQTKYILCRLAFSMAYLNKTEIAKLLRFCFPESEQSKLRSTVYQTIKNIYDSSQLNKLRRYPVILIIDELLDSFPWESLDVLRNHPVSRMPSLHFTYALYKQHETSIVNGFKIVDPTNGTYLINPGLDLKRMEARLKKFFNYWLPSWDGLIGKAPTETEFINLIASTDIFVYNGHGAGTQFISPNKIQQMRVNGVVMLFGCSSVGMDYMGPLVEMYDVFHNYLIACSPCVIGMLWEVTDFDTDILSTSLLSFWLPSKSATLHWQQIDKQEWDKGTIVSSKIKVLNYLQPKYQPELLRAINMARSETNQYMTSCAIVARGLPIKIINS